MVEPIGDSGVTGARADRVVSLGVFLRSAALSNGTRASIPDDIAGLLAEAVVHWEDGLVWSASGWVPLGETELDPDLGEVQVVTLGGGAVVKMTHIPTGCTALGEDSTSAWAELKRKVRDHGNTAAGA